MFFKNLVNKIKKNVKLVTEKVKASFTGERKYIEKEKVKIRKGLDFLERKYYSYNSVNPYECLKYLKDNLVELTSQNREDRDTVYFGISGEGINFGKFSGFIDIGQSWKYYSKSFWSGMPEIYKDFLNQIEAAIQKIYINPENYEDSLIDDFHFQAQIAFFKDE